MRSPVLLRFVRTIPRVVRTKLLAIFDELDCGGCVLPFAVTPVDGGTGTGLYFGENADSVSPERMTARRLDFFHPFFLSSLWASE
jgi:hypothetical protein